MVTDQTNPPQQTQAHHITKPTKVETWNVVVSSPSTAIKLHGSLLQQ
jgi:hypothetical protein